MYFGEEKTSPLVVYIIVCNETYCKRKFKFITQMCEVDSEKWKVESYGICFANKLKSVGKAHTLISNFQLSIFNLFIVRLAKNPELHLQLRMIMDRTIISSC